MTTSPIMIRKKRSPFNLIHLALVRSSTVDEGLTSKDATYTKRENTQQGNQHWEFSLSSSVFLRFQFTW